MRILKQPELANQSTRWIFWWRIAALISVWRTSSAASPSSRHFLSRKRCAEFTKNSARYIRRAPLPIQLLLSLRVRKYFAPRLLLRNIVLNDRAANTCSHGPILLYATQAAG